MNKVTIVGSINVDNIMHIKKLPQPGETIAMSEFSKAAGGKGANQAVASSRAKNETIFVGRVGDDDNGRFMLEQFKENGINVDHVAITPNQQTGQAYILLQETGQNSIIIQHGANFDVTAEDVRNAKSQIEDSDFVIAQFETPIEANIEANLNIRGYQDQVYSVMCNLIDNAIKHNPTKTMIIVTWKKVDAGAYFSVQDNGVGIARHHLNRLTERFYQADSSHTYKKNS